jgi:hypothetical protein
LNQDRRRELLVTLVDCVHVESRTELEINFIPRRGSVQSASQRRSVKRRILQMVAEQRTGVTVEPSL